MSIEISESAGVRSLHFGTPWIQGSMRVARPWSLELQYTREMMLPLLLRDQPDWPARVLMVGLGAGSMAKFLYRHQPACVIDVVELDPQVIAAAHRHFRLPPADERLRIHCADGFEWMTAGSERHDLILLDAFDRHARAHRLESAAFYQACARRLAPRGWLSCNLLTLHRSHGATRRALHGVFGDALRLLPPCAEGNVVALAGPGAWPAADFVQLRELAADLRRRTGLNLLPLLARLERD